MIEKAATALDSSYASQNQVYLFVGIFRTRNMFRTFVPLKIFPPSVLSIWQLSSVLFFCLSLTVLAIFNVYSFYHFVDVIFLNFPILSRLLNMYSLSSVYVCLGVEHGLPTLFDYKLLSFV